jgi:transposase
VEAASSNRAITPSGRSHGGLSTKINAAADGRGRPLAILLTPGQAGDAPMRLPLLAHLRVQRTIGRPRTRPDRVLADKAYSSRAIRAHLRTRGIGSVIPEPDDQKCLSLVWAVLDLQINNACNWGQALRDRPPAALPASLRAGRIRRRAGGGGRRLDRPQREPKPREVTAALGRHRDGAVAAARRAY